MSSSGEIKQGKSEAAEQLQQALIILGYPLTADGHYGRGTAAQVKAFVANQRLAGLSPTQAEGLEVGQPVLEALTRQLASALAAHHQVRDDVEQLVADLAAADPGFMKSLQKHVDDISAMPDDYTDAKTRALREAFDTLSARVTRTPSVNQEAWARFKGQVQDADRDGHLLGSARVMKGAVFQMKTDRLDESIGLVSSALRQVDPEFAQRVLRRSQNISDLPTDQTKITALTEARDALKNTVTKNWSLLSPEAKGRWQEIADVIDGVETSKGLDLARFMQRAFIDQLLTDLNTERLANGPSPANTQLHADVLERITKLEAMANARASRPVTGEMLRKIVPTLSQARADLLAPDLNYAMEQAGIDEPSERASFISQTAHESGAFRYTVELGPDSYFDMYEGRASLGNNQTGDGARFKGRGFIQLTGRKNYTAAGSDLFQKGLLPDRLIDKPDLAGEMPGAWLVSTWFWDRNHLNEALRQGGNDRVGKIINGRAPPNGAAERTAYYVKALAVLS